MLTEIEWWGGILIVWACLSYGMAFKGSGITPKISLVTTIAALSFASVVLTVALYFYPHELPIYQWAYIALVTIGILVTIAMQFVSEPEDDLPDNASADEEEEEEVELVFRVAGDIVFWGPIVGSFALGCYKISVYLFDLI